MTFNTGNNVPSTDPRDLYDNAENLDKLLNGADPFYADRKGVLRQSYAGMENDFDTAQEGRETAFTLSQADKEIRFQAFLVSSGYVSKGDYAVNVVLEERNEYVAVDAATTGTSPGLYRPNASATLPLTLTGTWATDSANLVLLGDDVLRQELAASAGGIGLVANGRKVVNASQHGCTSGADISVPLQAAADLADLWGCPLVMDIPNAILSIPVLLPQQFDGQGCVFTGDVIVRYRKHAQIGNFRCSNLFTQAVWHGHIHDIDVDDVWSVEGYDPEWGLFYSNFSDIRCGQIKLDVSKQAVNGNSFRNCLGTKVGVYGLLITDNGASSSAGIIEAHANAFYNCDFSHSLGARNEVAVRNQTNYLISCYMEHGAIPYGNWTIGAAGMIIDGSSPPVVTPFNHVIGMAEVSPATMGDSISASIQNLCIGGDWSVRDANGVPPGFSASFAASAVGTSGAPYGFTGMYGGLASGAYQSLNVKFRTATGKFSAIVWVYSGAGVLPDNIVISDGVTESYRDAANAYNAGGGWYLYRISGTATIGADATIGLMVNGAGGGTKEIYLGAAWVTDSKAALFPSFSEPVSSETVATGGMEIKRGVTSQGYVSGAAFIDVAVTYGSPFRGGGLNIVPSITLQPASGYEGKATHYEVLPGSMNAGFTVRIYYTGDWAGTVCWTAMTC